MENNISNTHLAKAIFGFFSVLVLSLFIDMGPFGFMMPLRVSVSGNESSAKNSVSLNTNSGNNLAHLVDNLLNTESKQKSGEVKLATYVASEANLPVSGGLKTNGFIIKFKEDPVLVKYADAAMAQSTLARSTLLNSQAKSYKGQLSTTQQNYVVQIRSKLTTSKTKSGERYFQNTFNGAFMDITPEEASEVKKLSFVDDVYPNFEATAILMNSVPLIEAVKVWQLDQDGNNCAETKKQCITGKGTKIAIIDTGVDYTHPDLGGCFGAGCKVASGYDFVNYDFDPMDDMGHGTHVAATAAGKGVLNGVAPDAEIYAYKVLNNYGSGWYSTIIAGIERSVDPNNDGNYSDRVDVLNLSLGGWGNPDDPLSTAVDTAVDAGVVAVVAAGNSGPGEMTIGTPGAARNAITVGATDKSNKIATFSSRGPIIWSGRKLLAKPDVVAPGVSICAAEYDGAWSNYRCLDNKHIAISGTSMATPHVAGVAALIKQKNPTWTPLDIKMALRNTALNLSLPTNTQGYGRIRALNAVFLAKEPCNAQMREPLKESNFVFFINGIANCNGYFSNWTLEYGLGYEPKQWTLVTKSSTPANGFLANWNASTVPDGIYSLRLTVYGNDGSTLAPRSIDKQYALVDHALLPGWPVHLNNAFSNGLTIADVNSDGISDVVVHAPLQEHALTYEGKEVPSWPTQKRASGLYTSGQPSSAAVTKGTNNGSAIISAFSYDSYGANTQCFYLFDSSAKSVTGWPKRCETQDGSWADPRAPMFYDLNGDGNKEIIAQSFGGATSGLLPRLHVFNQDGTNFMKWPYTIDKKFNNSDHGVVAGDIDGDGKAEIVGMMTDTSTNPLITHLFIWNYDGTLRKDIVFNANFDYVFGQTLLTDIDGDGKKDVGVFSNYGSGCSYTGGRFRWLKQDGSAISGWPASFQNQFIAKSATLSDLDKDGKPETIFGTVNACGPDNNIYAFRSDGTNLPGWPVHVDGDVFSEVTSSDVNGDSYPDVLASTPDGKIYAWSHVGQLIQGFPKYMGGQSTSGVAIGDINGDGKADIVSSTWDGDIFAWGLNVPYKPSATDWPQFGRDAQHTSCFNCGASTGGGGTTHTVTITSSTPKDGFATSTKSSTVGNWTNVGKDASGVKKAYLYFDTSSIPSAANVTRATVTVYGTNMTTKCIDVGDLDIYACKYDPLTKDDFNVCTPGPTQKTGSYLNLPEYYGPLPVTIDIQSQYVLKGGITQLRLESQNTASCSYPNPYSRICMDSSSGAAGAWKKCYGGNNRPTMSVTYTIY